MKYRQKWTVVMAAALIVALLAGCGARSMTAGGADAESEYHYAVKDKETQMQLNEAPSAMFDSMVSDSKTEASGSVYQNSDVKLIRRAWLTVQTTEFDRSIAALEALVEQLEGYYESAELYSGNYYNQGANRSGDYTIRIPSGSYDTFMAQVDGVGHLSRRNESSEDVGEAYYDLEARLKTQRTKQERLLELLKQARSMEDIIALESALTEVEYHIEQYTSQLNRYDGLIGYATIHVSLEEKVKILDEPGEKASVFARMKAGVASSAGGLVTGFQDLLVWVSYHLFGLIVLGGAVAVGVVFGRRYIKAKTSGKEPKTEDNPKAE